jgi:phosphoribosylformylglycinamidine synthase
MISESQERMLAVVEPDRLDEVLEVCRRWQTSAAVIGEVTADDRLRVLSGDDVVGDVPVSALVDDCPAYDLEPAEPDHWLYPNRATLEGSASGNEILLGLLGSASVASKRWVFEQYDPIVQSRTVRRPESADAAVLRLEETGSAIALAIDGNGRRVACDPYGGTIEAVLECAANLACVGAEPLGLTNCLNFGSPEKPHIAWQLERSVAGLADACGALDVPVVGGNVSLYNEGTEGPIYPTPVVGMVGELPDPDRAGGVAFRAEGDAIALVGPFSPSLAGSELAKLRGELDRGLPGTGVGAVRRAIEAVRDAVRSGAVVSAHDVSDGGLACAIAECAIGGGIGAKLDLDPLVELRGGSGETCLFGEGPGGFVVTGEREALERVGGGDVDVLMIGSVGGDRLEVDAAELSVDVALEDAASAWRSLAERMDRAG